MSKKIYFICSFFFILLSCKDDNVPEIDKTEISKEQILGGWKVQETRTLVNITPAFKPQVSSLNLKEKLNDKLDEKTEGVSLYFKEDMVYFLREGFVRDSSKYVLTGYQIFLDNPQLIGFYAPMFYIKFKDGYFIPYLRRAETLDLLEEDGSLDSWMGTIRKVVEDAECELLCVPDYWSIYDEL